jgi:5-methylcytosine-specific restriction endonuclease McrA
MTEKICNRCEVIKPLDEFRNQPKGKFGKRSKCKACEYQLYKEYYQKNPQKKRDAENKYRKNNPEVFARRDRKYYLKNKDKMLEANKKWKQDNPDKYAELNRRKERVRRARKFENGQKPYTEIAMLELYGTVCHLCESAIDMAAPRKVGTPGWELGLHVDHVIPLSKGGPDTLENVRPAHGKCNLQKQNVL